MISSSQRRATMRVLLVCLVPATTLLAEVDAREVIRRAVAADERNWKAARNYGFSERVDARRLDSHGQVKSKEVKSYDVTLLEGSPYRRLAGRDDRPLPPGDEKKEQEKLAESLAERRKETATKRALRLAKYESRPEWQREAWRELPEAFDFRLAGEEMRDGNRLYVIEATPRQEYQPRSRTAKVLVHLQGKLWVDKQDYHLVKAEVEVIDTISVGLFLVRLAKGSRAAFEQARVNDEVWLPRRVQVVGSARLGLLKVLNFEQEVIYSNSRALHTGSLVISHLKAKEDGEEELRLPCCRFERPAEEEIPSSSDADSDQSGIRSRPSGTALPDPQVTEYAGTVAGGSAGPGRGSEESRLEVGGQGRDGQADETVGVAGPMAGGGSEPAGMFHRKPPGLAALTALVLDHHHHRHHRESAFRSSHENVPRLPLEGRPDRASMAVLRPGWQRKGMFAGSWFTRTFGC